MSLHCVSSGEAPSYESHLCTILLEESASYEMESGFITIRSAESAALPLPWSKSHLFDGIVNEKAIIHIHAD